MHLTETRVLEAPTRRSVFDHMTVDAVIHHFPETRDTFLHFGVELARHGASRVRAAATGVGADADALVETLIAAVRASGAPE